MKRTRRKEKGDLQITLAMVVSVLLAIILVRIMLIALWPDHRKSFWEIVVAISATPILAAALGTMSLRLWWRRYASAFANNVLISAES